MEELSKLEHTIVILLAVGLMGHSFQNARWYGSRVDGEINITMHDEKTRNKKIYI